MKSKWTPNKEVQRPRTINDVIILLTRKECLNKKPPALRQDRNDIRKPDSDVGTYHRRMRSVLLRI